MAEPKPSLQDRIRARQEGAFIGRAEPLAQFERNLTLPVDDGRRRFVFAVHGAAGVGKTSLVGQWRQLAESRGYATGYVGSGYDVLSALEQLTTSLAASGLECTTFGRRLAQYRKDRRAVDSDPNAPAGMSSLLTRSATRIALRAAGDLPFVGAFTDEIDKDEAAVQADQVRAFLARRFGRRHDLDLLLSPVDVLSRAFVTDLRQAARRQPSVLFFDAFESTGRYLNGWLLQLLDGRYGDLPEDIVLVVSGQEPLDANLWAGYLTIRADVELQVFTAAETHQLLAAHGIVDPATVELIIGLSGRLPVLVAMLAAAAKDGTIRASDSTGTAVERFLHGVSDLDRQRAAQAAALCRRLDRETVAIASGAAADFDWLRRLPFVVAQPDGYYYHDVVRTMMIRSYRRTDPDDWPARHRALAEHYRRRQDALDLPVFERWRDDRWLDLKLEETYHDLCAAGTPALRDSLHGLIDVYRRTSDGAVRWARTIAQAGDDSGVEALRTTGADLTRRLTGEPADVIALLGQLAGDRSLDDQHRWYGWFLRSQLQTRSGDHAAALLDLDHADEFFPGAATKELRGQIHADLGEYDQALLHLDEAARLDPQYGMVFTTRSEVHRLLEQYDAALEDINRALELRPADPALLAGRGALYLDLDRTSEARADLDHAIALAPAEPTWLLWRSHLFLRSGRFTEALADVDRAVELDPSSTEARGERALLSGILGRTEPDPGFDPGFDPELQIEVAVARAMGRLVSGDASDTVPDLSRLIESNPDNPLLYYGRGSVFRSLGRFDEALADLGRAIELDPEPLPALAERAEVYTELSRFDEALADLDRALGSEPHSVELWTTRAQLNNRAGRREAALADLDRAAGLAPDSGEVMLTRRLLGADAGDPDEAMRKLDRAIARNPDDMPAVIERAQTRLQRGRYAAAIEDFDSILRFLPNNHAVHALRAHALYLLGDTAAARREFDRAVQLTGRNGSVLAMRGRFHYRTGDHQAALGDYTRAVELLPTRPHVWIGRGRAGLALGRYADAAADFERAAVLEPVEGWAFYGQALTWWYRGAADRVPPLLQSAVAASIGRMSDLSGPLPDDLPGQLDALHGLVPKYRDCLELVIFATGLGETPAASRLLAAVLRSGTAVDAVKGMRQDVSELGRFVGADAVAPLIEQLSRP
ncbi:tetratricopeptide repeat protein [Kribbella sp. NPDC000426]|uniref:tetratricopeptide repeat protein n=1 Tax=Kribbella sp. NPDC000426 TaxID=3154255 RepID=UPI003323E558